MMTQLNLIASFNTLLRSIFQCLEATNNFKIDLTTINWVVSSAVGRKLTIIPTSWIHDR